MNDFLPFVVIGLSAGSIYGLAGTGLVLTFRTSGVFNFAYGAIAAAAAFTFSWLWIWRGIDWHVSALIAVVGAGSVIGLVLERITRALARVSTEYQVVAMVGLTLGISGLLAVWRTRWGTPSSHATGGFNYLPTETFRISGVNIGYDQAITMVVALVATLLLVAFFRSARSGLAMRAVVDNADLVAVTGTNPTAIRRSAWIIGTIFAALSGVLLTPIVGLNSLLLVLLVVQAFGAAAVGHFSNLPLTYLGGLAIGIAASISTKYIGTIDWLGGLPASVPFIVLFAALLVTPRRLLVDRRATPPPPPRDPYTPPMRVTVGLGVVVFAALAVVPSLVGNDLSFWTIGVMTVILFLSLGLLVRESGQVSLCQYAFAAVGAAAFSHLAVDFGLPWVLALLLAGLITVPVGLLIAIPALRLSGVYLALATLGFGILVEKMLYLRAFMFGATADGVHAPRPSFAMSDTAYYRLVLVVTALAALLVLCLTRARLGRFLGALRDSPLALSTSGASTSLTKALVFGISAFLAGAFGALYAGFVGSVNGATFPSFSSLTIVAVVVLAFGGTPWYALVAATFFSIIPSYVDVDSVQAYVQIIFGLGAILVGIRSIHPLTTPGWARTVLDRVGGRPGRPTTRVVAPTVAPGPRPDARRRESVALELISVRVQYGGLVAVRDVSIEVPPARVTGLIGPNGAGKTTIFNAASGLIRMQGGTVRIGGVDVTRASPAARARRGLGRTFQRSEIWGSYTVRENVLLGREARFAGGSFPHQVFASPRSRGVIEREADDALLVVGIGALQDRQAATLTTGERRLVELARVVAGGYDVICLDEPSSGLDHEETVRFAAVLRRVVAERGTGLLLVEHDMSLVMDVCEHIYVMEFGQVIGAGTPHEIRGDAAVQAAYLGA